MDNGAGIAGEAIEDLQLLPGKPCEHVRSLVDAKLKGLVDGELRRESLSDLVEIRRRQWTVLGPEGAEGPADADLDVAEIVQREDGARGEIRRRFVPKNAVRKGDRGGEPYLPGDIFPADQLDPVLQCPTGPSNLLGGITDFLEPPATHHPAPFAVLQNHLAALGLNDQEALGAVKQDEVCLALPRSGVEVFPAGIEPREGMEDEVVVTQPVLEGLHQQRFGVVIQALCRDIRDADRH